MPCSLEENQETLTHLQQLFGWHTKVHRQTEWRELSRCKSGGLEPSAQKWLFQKLVWKTFAAVSTSLFYFVSNYDKHNVAQKWSCLIFYFFFQLFSFFLVQFFVAIQDLSFSCLFDMKISQFQHRKEKSNVFCLLKKKKNASPYTYFFVTYAFFLDNLRTSLSLHQSFLWQLNIWGQV